ncbi:hypothetical protein BDW22DRAFT_662461 [Trametopsis cervina]|nr:hypothetical protein BDW22DRAFT_662461 [Trametopsis cervina]
MKMNMHTTYARKISTSSANIQYSNGKSAAIHRCERTPGESNKKRTFAGLMDTWLAGNDAHHPIHANKQYYFALCSPLAEPRSPHTLRAYVRHTISFPSPIPISSPIASPCPCPQISRHPVTQQHPVWLSPTRSHLRSVWSTLHIHFPVLVLKTQNRKRVVW